MSSAFSNGAFILSFVLAGVLTLIVGTGLVFSIAAQSDATCASAPAQ